jgi:hypothetical protein
MPMGAAAHSFPQPEMAEEEAGVARRRRRQHDGAWRAAAAEAVARKQTGGRGEWRWYGGTDWGPGGASSESPDAGN